MKNLNYLWIDIQCPKCNYIDKTQLIDAKTERQIYCHNCKIIIQLKDDNASVHCGIENVNKALKSIENLFKNI